MNGDRLHSGHPPLDEIMGGGLPANGISIIIGLPGTGKTIIAQQYTFHNARPDRPAVYFSTLSEPREKIVRFGQSLDFSMPPRLAVRCSTRTWARWQPATGSAG